jgi:hypothetical protein
VPPPRMAQGFIRAVASPQWNGQLRCEAWIGYKTGAVYRPARLTHVDPWVGEIATHLREVLHEAGEEHAVEQSEQRDSRRSLRRLHRVPGPADKPDTRRVIRVLSGHPAEQPRGGPSRTTGHGKLRASALHNGDSHGRRLDLDHSVVGQDRHRLRLRRRVLHPEQPNRRCGSSSDRPRRTWGPIPTPEFQFVRDTARELVANLPSQYEYLATLH